MSAAVAVDPPLRCAVLVQVVFIGGTALEWDVLHANCDLAAARDKAAEWSAANLGKTAVVMVYSDHVCASVETRWSK